MKTFISIQNLRMIKNFSEKKKKRENQDRVADQGKQCTRPNYIINFSFLFLLVEIFFHPKILHEYGCFHRLSFIFLVGFFKRFLIFFFKKWEHGST